MVITTSVTGTIWIHHVQYPSHAVVFPSVTLKMNYKSTTKWVSVVHWAVKVATNSISSTGMFREGRQLPGHQYDGDRRRCSGSRLIPTHWRNIVMLLGHEYQQSEIRANGLTRFSINNPEWPVIQPWLRFPHFNIHISLNLSHASSSIKASYLSAVLLHLANRWDWLRLEKSSASAASAEPKMITRISLSRISYLSLLTICKSNT